MNDLSHLEYLSCVNRVQSEIKNHLELDDLTLAEFVVTLVKPKDTLDDFKVKLDKIGAQFPLPLIQSVYRFVKTMLPAGIQKKKKVKVKKEKDIKEPNGKAFEGLVQKDDYERIQNMMADEMKEKELKDFVKSMDSKNPDLEIDRRNDSDRVREHYARPSERESFNEYGMKRRRDSPERRNFKKRERDAAKLDNAAVLNKIYDGTVNGVKDFGLFISLHGIKERTDGLAHISNLTAGRVGHPADVADRGDVVKVKVISIEESKGRKKIGLSMKDVDQTSGQDLTESANYPATGAENLTGIVFSSQKAKKRLTSPERFEIKQLIASGVLNPKDYPDFDEDTGLLHVEDIEQEFELELNTKEPEFLKGQTQRSLQVNDY